MSVVSQIPDDTHTVYFGTKLEIIEQPNLSDCTDIYTLFLNNNYIHTVVSQYFPAHIEHVNLASNYITSAGLPLTWPNTIKTLNLDYNPIVDTCYVHIWPSSLTELSMDDTELIRMPRGLPPSLKLLSVIGCKLTSIDSLPYTLKQLRASYNTIKVITLLPRHLVYIHLGKNMLQSSAIFSKRLPPNLKVLNLEHNRLTWLPSEFPDSLEILHLSNNFITEFVSKVPKNLNMLVLNNNRIRIFRPVLGNDRLPQITVYIKNNCITESLANYPRITRIRTIYQSENWNQEIHIRCAKIIQYYYARFKIEKGFRSWARLYKFRDELLETSMHPGRLGLFEPFPVWTMKNKDHTV
jgi:Leucine-rich repeat (LRR) protein